MAPEDKASHCPYRQLACLLVLNNLGCELSDMGVRHQSEGTPTPLPQWPTCLQNLSLEKLVTGQEGCVRTDTAKKKQPVPTVCHAVVGAPAQGPHLPDMSVSNLAQTGLSPTDLREILLNLEPGTHTPSRVFPGVIVSHD